MAVSVFPRETRCECCGATVALDPLGWLCYEEGGYERCVCGQALPCSECGADVFVFVGDLSLWQSAAVYFSGVTH